MSKLRNVLGKRKQVLNPNLGNFDTQSQVDPSTGKFTKPVLRSVNLTANPDSSSSDLNNLLKNHLKGRRIAVLGNDETNEDDSTDFFAFSKDYYNLPRENGRRMTATNVGNSSNVY